MTTDVKTKQAAADLPPEGFGGLGPWGRAVRCVVGLLLVLDVFRGHWVGGWHPAAWLLGLVVFPIAVSAGVWLRGRRDPAMLRATGPVGHAINLGVFLALYLTWWYAPPIDYVSDAALIFYGSSMVLAAIRSYPGCEVLAIPNLLLGRDDQVGCTLFWLLDAAEARRIRGISGC